MTGADPAADVLQRAAVRLREAATCAIPGPWVARHTTNDGWPIDDEPRTAPGMDDDAGPDDEFGTISLVAGSALPRTDGGMVGRDPSHYQSHHILAEHDEGDLAPEQAQELLDSYRWVAVVGPQVAEPLAALLAHTALLVDVNGRTQTDALALDLARALLGEPTGDGGADS